MKKYEFVKEDFVVMNDHLLYRIKAVRDFGSVKVGDLGGYIEKEENLSHEGDCWVDDNAMVYEDATVYDDGKVSGYAKVNGRSRIHDYAHVYGNTTITDNAQVNGHAQVYGNAKLHSYASASECAKVYKNANVGGFAGIYGCVNVCGNAIVNGKTILSGSIFVYDGAIKGNYLFGGSDIIRTKEDLERSLQLTIAE